jgi:hypothetical protein
MANVDAAGAHTGSPRAGRSGWRLPAGLFLCRAADGCRLLLLTLLLLLAGGAGAQQSPPPKPASPPADSAPPRPAHALDATLVIFSEGSGTDLISFGYNSVVSKAVVEQDVATLARELKQPVPKVKVAVREGITTAEARMSGLTNWATGEVALDPIIRTFQRFGHFQVGLFTFQGTFPLKSAEPIVRGALRVEVKPTGSSVIYDIRLDQGALKGEPPSVVQRPFPWVLAALLGVVTLLVMGAVFLLVKGQVEQRRAAAARHGES